jgi:hypothetical protein
MTKTAGMNDFESMKAALDDFLRKEGSSLNRYDIFAKKAWLTIDKPEPEAEQFARVLKNMADSFTKSSWKVYYKRPGGK